MAEYRGTNQPDNLVGTVENDSFEELGAGNDTVNGGGEFDFVNYEEDGGTAGIIAIFGANGNGTVVDSHGDTDTITSVQAIKGTDAADQFTFQAGADFNVEPGRGADRLVFNNIGFGTLDYAFYFNDEVVDFVRELNLDLIGITLDFAAGTVTEFNGTIDTFTPVDNLDIRGTRINDVMRAGDDGIETVLDGRGGSDLLIAGDEFDRASYRREGEDTGTGFDINLATGRVTTTANTDVDTLEGFRRVEGSDFADTFTGSGANEEMWGRGGNDSINGGDGIDTAIYWQFDRDDYAVSGIGTSTITITHLNGGRDGTDTLTNIERINYENGILRVDINGNAGEVYRLYEAAFDRTPDQDGLSYWIDERDDGATMTQIANNFILSDEFQDLYGDPETLTNDAFLTLVYQNVLDRTPDQAGFAYWTSELERGFGRDAVLASFSESDENIANVAPAISNGIFFEFS
jgi:hypothetical protein